jgi:hypothetical protein
MRVLSFFATVLLIPGAISAQSAPTFSKDVAPLLNRHCVSCHRPGEMAPMSLTGFEKVRPWAKAIKEKVALGVMPPWHSDAPQGTFANDRRLKEAEKSTIIRWVDAGAPEGNPKDLPPAPKFPEGWEIGTPDVVLKMPVAFEVPAQGTVPYKNFTMPTNFTEDKWVQAIEIRPGERSVVHHILAFVREPSGKRERDAFTVVVPQLTDQLRERLESSGPGEGPGTLIATTAPGTNAMKLQPGSAMRIPAGATITFQVHYTANGKTAVSDQSSIGMVFAKQPPRTATRTSAFMNPFLSLPAGEADQAVPTAIEFKEDAHITAIFPHTHLRGKSWEYRLVYPDGRSQVVLPVPNYDFNWQTYYIFNTPVAAPKGARLEAVAHYDNSANNKSNPDPTIAVKWGQQTWQEMQYTGITYTVDGAAPAVTAEQR